MHKKILTLDDLVKFCEQQNFAKFSSAESGYQLCVTIPAQFEKEDDDDSLMLFADVLLMHTAENRNHSALTEKAGKNCLSSIPYKPVLANFAEFDGEWDFTSHDIEIDEDGNYNYIERQVGCFTADKATLDEEADDKGRKYIHARVAIPREYTKAAEIIERKNGTKVSAELAVNEMSYSADEHLLYLDDVEVMGVTLLGRDPETGEEVGEGMEGARLDIADFSINNNSIIANQQDKLIESLDKLTNMLANFNINNPAESGELKEGGNLVNKFEELLEQYGKTVEDIDFEYDNLTDEELEAKFAEVFGESAGEGDDEPEPTSDDDDTAEEDFADEEQNDEEDEKAEDGDDEEFEEEVAEDNQREFSVTCGDSVRNFAVSMSEVLAAMSELVNNTYSETDNDYYSVDVYESEKSVVMVGWWSGKAYKQSYKVRNDVYTLTGDRVAVKPVYLTADEEAKLDDMRSNYSLISEKLAKYESEPQKVAILESDDYANVADVEAFVELKKQENHFDLSVDEVTEKANQILLDYAKHNNIKFSDDSEKKSVGQKKLPVGSKRKSSRYGNLFSKR